MPCCGSLAVCGSKAGPLFQFDDKQPLKRSKFVALLRQVLMSAGIEAVGYTGHSFRVSSATTTAQCGMYTRLHNSVIR